MSAIVSKLCHAQCALWPLLAAVLAPMVLLLLAGCTGQIQPLTVRQVQEIRRDLPASLRADKCGPRVPFPTEAEFKAAGSDQPWADWSISMVERDECMTGLVSDIWTWNGAP